MPLRLSNGFTILLVLCVALSINGRKFEFYNDHVEPREICMILDIDMDISVTMLNGAKILDNIHLSIHDANIITRSICGSSIALTWPNGIFFTINGQGSILDFAVSFDPTLIFPDFTKNTKRIIYVGPKEAKLLDDQSSYKCSKWLFHDFFNDAISKDGVHYNVRVEMRHIQVQLKNLNDGGFGPSGPECQTQDSKAKVSKTNQFLYRHWKFIVIVIGVLVALVVAGISVYIFYRRHQSRNPNQRDKFSLSFVNQKA